ncbi:MAG: hypothetical protein JWN15_356, partial [Firmicutes bacterium]|nr:hypothetical protein [Bacillota bacterium]
AGGRGTQGAARGIVLVPAELLLDTRAKTTGKLLYAIMQCSPDLANSAARLTYSNLAAVAGLSVNTVKAAVLRLHQTGWLQAAKSNKFRPIHFTLRNPADERYRSAVAGIAHRIGKAQHKGEALMREYLSLIIASDHYDDDASPGFLVNPYTGEEMQLDRYYSPSVAFEFQGAQHFGPTKRYPDEDEARKQQARDHMKAGICKREHIDLILVHPEDLSLNALREKVPALLPQRDLAGAERLIANLERRSRSYREEAKKA